MDILDTYTGKRIGEIRPDGILLLTQEFQRNATLNLQLVPDALSASASVLERDFRDLRILLLAETCQDRAEANTESNTSPFNLECRSGEAVPKAYGYGFEVPTTTPVTIAIVDLTPVRFSITITSEGRALAKPETRNLPSDDWRSPQKWMRIPVGDYGSYDEKNPCGLDELFVRMFVIMRAWGFNTERLLGFE